MTFTPKIYIGCPEYGRPEEHSVLARYTCKNPNPAEGEAVELCQPPRVVASSLLPRTFNTLFCEAMDLRDEGKCTHFAMLHDDIWPDNFWLNTLWREMRKAEADLVSVVMPIRDVPWWRSSTAIGLVDNPWVVPRYIRAEDREVLPLTFGPEDVCGPGEVLLHNTGCWLADLRRPYWDAFNEAGGFNFDTRITRDENGKRLSWIQSEDWKMSRFIQSQGARAVATYAVTARHRGAAWWSNDLNDALSVQWARCLPGTDVLEGSNEALKLRNGHLQEPALAER